MEASDLFLESIVKKASQFHFVDNPVLSRKRKEPNYRKMTDIYNVTRRSKSSEPYHPLTQKEHYKQIYFEVLDVMINSVKEKFSQPSYNIFASLKSLLLKTINHPEQSDEELKKSVAELYKDEIDLTALNVESNIFRAIMKTKPVCFRDIYKDITGCSKADRGPMPNIVHVVKLLLVNPATSCTLEQSFSTAQRLKTWLRATMKSECFNDLSILSIHKELTDALDLTEVGKEFVNAREGRLNYFGRFYYFSKNSPRTFSIFIYILYKDFSLCLYSFICSLFLWFYHSHLKNFVTVLANPEVVNFKYFLDRWLLTHKTRWPLHFQNQSVGPVLNRSFKEKIPLVTYFCSSNKKRYVAILLLL